MRISDVSVPEIYKESADFRFFCKWFETALEKTQYDTENLLDLYDPQRCPSDLLWALADTMGFRYDDRFPTSYNRLILLYFMSMIYNRGSKNGMTLAAETNLAQFPIELAIRGYTDEQGNVVEGKNILNNRLDNTTIPVNSVFVTPHTAEGYIDLVYFSTKVPKDACIEYVRPIGMYVFQHAGVRYDARTKISIDARLTNQADLRMSVGPTFVGHYRRADYASLQSIVDDELVDRESVWYRNSDYESTEQEVYPNPGYRALASLQLSNNEHIVKSLIDPIFSLGFGPQTIDVTYPDDYYNAPLTSNAYNLRYDRNTDESYTHKNLIADEYDVSVIDDYRTTDVLNPRPAVNPIMAELGDAMSSSEDNSTYYPTFHIDALYTTDDDLLVTTNGEYIFVRGSDISIESFLTADNQPFITNDNEIFYTRG